ncbi:MAG: lipoyl(octanoyl) transferase LipB [Cuniculiplasma sp.]
MSEEGLKDQEINENINFLIFKHLDYSDGLDLQRKVNLEQMEGKGNEAIIICEHNDVYTCGIHREQVPPGITNLYMIERGGGITYHGPGQLIVYFLMDLGKRGINMLDLIKFVHECEIEYLKQHGIEGESRLKEETGIWVKNRKICSTGFSLKGGFTMHGVAINVNTDLKKFSIIKPCGLDSVIMTSISQINEESYNTESEKRLFFDIIIKNLGIKEPHYSYQ